ncbi:MAG: hypothetical protein RLZZ515_1044, partial [Cyanobacteriota bacterium]
PEVNVMDLIEKAEEKHGKTCKHKDVKLSGHDCLFGLVGCIRVLVELAELVAMVQTRLVCVRHAQTVAVDQPLVSVDDCGGVLVQLQQLVN